MNGDFYINTATNQIFGPKTAGAWGSGTSLVGPAGATGATGPQGPIGLTGATGPQGPTGLLSSGTLAGNTPYWNGTSWVVNSNNIFNNGGNIGIGTATPSYPFHVYKSANGLFVSSLENTSATGHGLEVRVANSTNVGVIEAYGGGTQLFRLMSNGRLGLGISVPATKLDVAGTGRFTSSTYNDPMIELNQTYSPAGVSPQYGIHTTLNSNQNKTGIYNLIQGTNVSESMWELATESKP
ncbi:MAG: collagen-like protein [Bacteroidetes bacterium]|nr:collagen-like protein [Bacteroidota bacterium]